jgi:hypothetical protein
MQILYRTRGVIRSLCGVLVALQPVIQQLENQGATITATRKGWVVACLFFSSRFRRADFGAQQRQIFRFGLGILSFGLFFGHVQ